MPARPRSCRLLIATWPARPRQRRTVQRLRYSFTLDGTKTLASITLPGDNNVAILSISAVGLIPAPTNLTPRPLRRLDQSVVDQCRRHGHRLQRLSRYDPGNISTTPLNSSPSRPRPLATLTPRRYLAKHITTWSRRSMARDQPPRIRPSHLDQHHLHHPGRSHRRVQHGRHHAISTPSPRAIGWRAMPSAPTPWAQTRRSARSRSTSGRSAQTTSSGCRPDAPVPTNSFRRSNCCTG